MCLLAAVATLEPGDDSLYVERSGGRLAVHPQVGTVDEGVVEHYAARAQKVVELETYAQPFHRKTFTPGIVGHAYVARIEAVEWMNRHRADVHAGAEQRRQLGLGHTAKAPLRPGRGQEYIQRNGRYHHKG